MGTLSRFTQLSGLLLASALALALAPRAGSAMEIPATLAGPDLGRPVSATASVESKLAISEAARATVVVFLSAKCPCSQSHEAALAKLHAEYAPKGFKFVGIHSNADEPAALAGEHFAKAALPFPVLADPGQKYLEGFGALKTPHVFVVDRDGKLRFQGGVDDSKVHATAKRHFLKDALAALDAGQEPPMAVARALGCAIKRN